jgi:hypothetical protein
MVKDAIKKLFLTDLKKLVKSWNLCVEIEGDYVDSIIISSASVYLKFMSFLFLKSPFTFRLTPIMGVTLHSLFPGHKAPDVH